MENPFEIIIQRLDRIERILSAINLRPNVVEQAQDRQMMNLEQAADYLDLSKSSLYKHTANRTIPHYKVGKRVFFQRSDLNSWISEKRVSTHEEIIKTQ